MENIRKYPLVVVGIPAYNEEQTIARVILKARRYADVVIVCDDGSTDMTGEIAERLGARVIRHEKNFGKGAALRSLFEEGRRIKAEVLVTLDADDQHDPSEVPRLIEPVLAGRADVVVGSRFRSGNSIPAFRRFGNRVLNYLTNLLIGGKIEDTQSGFRAYSKRALSVIDVVEDGLSVDSQILVDAKEKNLIVVEVPVSVKYPRSVKTSKRNIFRHGSEVVVSLIELFCERRPLVFLGIPGLILLGAGGIALIMVLSIFNVTRKFATGTAVLGVMLTLMGVIFILGALTFWIISRWLNRLEKRFSSKM